LKNWRLIRLGLLFVVVGAVLFGAAVPALRSAVVKNKQVKQVQLQLARMDQWSIAGRWLEQSTEQRAAEIDREYERLFPDQRFKEQLFLDLARIADLSKVEAFNLKELSGGAGIPGGAGDMDDDANAMGDPGAGPVGGGGGMDFGADPASGDIAGGSGGGMNPGSPGADPGMMDPAFMDPASAGAAESTARDDVGSLLGGPDLDLPPPPTLTFDTYRVTVGFHGDYQRAARFLAELRSIDRALKVHKLVIMPTNEEISVNLELDCYVRKPI